MGTLHRKSAIASAFCDTLNRQVQTKFSNSADTSDDALSHLFLHMVFTVDVVATQGPCGRQRALIFPVQKSRYGRSEA